jgi:nitroreductase/ketosteroid isomerase-like protein
MEAIEALVSRRSAKGLVDPAPDEAALDQMLRAAIRAPDHGKLRPWRFILLRGEARKRLGEVMADAKRRSEPEVSAVVLDREREKLLRAPLVIVVAALIKTDHAIPVIEQILAAGAATENLMVAAHALGYGAAWKTGAAAYDNSVKQALKLTADDSIVGFIYLGTPSAPRTLPPAEDPANYVRVWVRHFLLALAVSTLVLVSARATIASAEDSQLREFRAATRALYDLEEKAYEDKDAATLVSHLYSEDAFVVSPNSTSLGKQQILAGYQRHMDGRAHLVSVKSYVNGNSGYDMVNFAFTPDDRAEKPVTFKALLLWEKRHGKWICLGNMFMPGAFASAESSAR